MTGTKPEKKRYGTMNDRYVYIIINPLAELII